MSIKEIAQRSRSYRRFDNSYAVAEAVLTDAIDVARYAPSARNAQTIKYLIVTDKSECAAVFGTLKWAGYLKEWDGPEPDERPSAYVIMLHDSNLGAYNAIDTGLCAELINLALNERGLGCCMIGAFDKPRLMAISGIAANLEPLLVLAVGKPTENVVVEPMRDGEIRYWRDERQTHHVPKRSLDEIILKDSRNDIPVAQR